MLVVVASACTALPPFSPPPWALARVQVLGSYRDAIVTGSKHTRQALPRLLTLFYEWGSDAHAASAGTRTLSSSERLANQNVRTPLGGGDLPACPRPLPQACRPAVWTSPSSVSPLPPKSLSSPCRW